MTVSIDVASPADLATIRALLGEAELPHSDLLDETSVRFWVARDREVIGAVGLEPFGTVGLLRSLVVAPRGRSSGLGSRLVQAVEDGAAAAGIRQLVLLTQTAERFFSQRGYAVIERATAPAELRESSEFKSLCPASASCMSKTLGRPR